METGQGEWKSKIKGLSRLFGYIWKPNKDAKRKGSRRNKEGIDKDVASLPGNGLLWWLGCNHSSFYGVRSSRKWIDILIEKYIEFANQAILMAITLLRHFPALMAFSRSASAEYSRPVSVYSQNTDCVLWAACLLARCLSNFHNQARFDLTDLTRPHTWYPLARRKKRNVLLHVGPTNSGKTYQALKQLELSSSGVYCGPLRLLAWEVAERLNKANVPCSLITGQEREEIAGAEHRAVTVEMADVTREYKCAVIDEIQMIGCTTRGFSFTRALLGLAVDELHLCGDPAAISLIQEMLSVTDDIIKVHYYERLSPLIPSERPLGSFLDIQRGDCIVAFSRRDIYSIKREVEGQGKHLCSVVYGSLPPETRTRQAKMFNDASSELDVLVASDAVGMGLNLNIRRIIFSTLEKFDGVQMRKLSVPEVKQIAGRAGRYGSMFPNGEVTCISGNDLPLLHSSLKAASPCLEAAGLFPSFDLLALYSRLHSDCTFHSVLEQFVEKAKLSSNYFITNCEAILKVAAAIEDLPLGLQDRYVFCISPVDMDNEISAQGLIQFAETYAKKGLVHLEEIFTPETLRVPKTQSAMIELESIHKVLDLYIWLSFRLEDSFPDREVASSQKALCGMLIEEYIERLGWKKPKRMRHLKQSKAQLFA